MAASTQKIKKLKAELAEIGKEIDKRIEMLEKMPFAGKQGYMDMKQIFADRQSAAEAIFRKSLMSTGCEVWDFAWENVWQAFQEFQSAASAETRQNYEGLEAGLKAKQSYLLAVLHLPEMFGDQVWTEIWMSVWNLIGSLNAKYKQMVTEKLLQADKELDALLAKQLELQNQLESLKSGGKMLWPS